MWRIRPEQMEAFERLSIDQFATDLVAFLREFQPSDVAGLADSEAKEIVVELLDRADGYGIDDEFGSAIYVSLAFSISLGFDEHPVIAAILEDPDIGGNERMDLLLRALPHEAWEDAQLNTEDPRLIANG